MPRTRSSRSGPPARTGILSGKAEIEDHREGGNSGDAFPALRLWRQLLEQLSLERAGQFAIDDPDQPD
jgi:hypothetical protein